ncbi:MAG TPA: PAS domain S-box protein [Terriglobia bacterium]|nr:PAS domain S-box protein [Terriglobia bacterium]
MSGTPFAPDPAVETDTVMDDSKTKESAGPDAVPKAGLEGPSFWCRGSFYRELAVQLVFLAVYILLDRASIEIRLWTGAPAWYLPAGLSVAILLCGGMRYLPIVIVSGVTVAALSHRPMLSLAGLPRDIAVSVYYAAGAVWLRRVWHLDLGLRRLRDVGGLALFLVAVNFPQALFSVLTYWADGLVSRQDFWKATFNWWVGDSISITSLTPFLLLFVAPRVGEFLRGERSIKPSGTGTGRRLTRSEALERIAELASIVIALWLVFGFKATVPYQPFYLLFFPFIWMAVRHGLRSAVLGVLAINLIVIVAAHTAHPDPEGWTRRQLMGLALALTGLCVGAVVSERREAEAALRQKSEELDSFFNVSLDLLCIATTDGYFLRLNPAWESTLGYSRDELRAKRFFDFVHPDDVEATRQATAVLAGQRNVVDFINRYRRKDGEYRWLEWRSAPAGNLVYAAARDVTERKRTQEELKRSQEELESVLASIPDYLWSAEIDGQGHSTYRYYSPVVEKITGRPPEFYLPGPERWLSTIHPDDRPRLQTAFEVVRAGQPPPPAQEYRIILPDGTVRWVRDSVRVRREGGSTRIDGVVSDITERMTAEFALRDREERFRKVFEEGPLGMTIVGPDGSLLRANATLCAMYGYTEEELRLLKVSDFTHPDDVARHLELTERALRGDIPGFRLEKRVIRKDGEVIWTDLAAAMVRAADGSPLYGLGMVQDITERKRTEQALRDSEQRYRDFIEHSNEGVWRVELEQPIPINLPIEEAVRRLLQYGNFAECNEVLARDMGFSAAKDLVGRRLGELVPASDEERMATFRAAARGGWQSRTVELRGRDKTGNFKHLLRTEVPIVENGMLVRVWGMTRDLTELKRAEEELRRSEQRWRAVFENSAVGIALTDCISTRFQAANVAFQKMVGYPEEELRALTFMGLTYEDDRETNRQLLSELLEGRRQSFALEKRYRRKDDSLLWVNLHVSLVPGTESVPRFSLAIVEDITERKHAEEALRESEARLRLAVSQLPAVVWSTDRELRFTSHLGAGLRALGVKSNQLVGKSVDAYVLSLGPQPDRPDHRLALAGESLSYELVIEGRAYTVHVEPLLNAEGEITGTAGIALDISERRRAETALRESEERFRATFENAGVGMALVNMQGHPIKSNPALRQMLGYSEEELSRTAFTALTHPDDRELDRDLFSELAAGKRDKYEIEKRYVKKGGGVLWGLLTVSLVKGRYGRPVYAVGMVEDITERKRAEEERQRSLEQLRALAARLEIVREEERKRVAREIHDQLGQALTAIKIDLSSLVRELPAEREQPSKRTSSIFKLLDETIQSVRRISTELRPGILDDLGLVATIEWAGEEFEARTGTKCRLDLPREDIAIDPERATAIFRIFQETLTNVARHADASEVDVRMAREDGDLTLEVRDNGKGVAEEQLSSGRSLGILGMRERALLLGGDLAISGAPGKGTTVRVRIPTDGSGKTGVVP